MAYQFTQTGAEIQDILDQVGTNTGDIAQNTSDISTLNSNLTNIGGRITPSNATNFLFGINSSGMPYWRITSNGVAYQFALRTNGYLAYETNAGGSWTTVRNWAPV